MNRLTKDLNSPHDDTTYSDVVKNAIDRENIVLTKLKHYEVLEEEHQCDLLLLLKALEQGYFYRKYTIDGGDENDEIICTNEKYKIVKINAPFYIGRQEQTKEFGICHQTDLWMGIETMDFYGSLWALTREELENDK